MWSDVVVALDAQRERLKKYGHVADRRGSSVLRPQSSVQPDRQTTYDRWWPWIWFVVIVVSGFGIAAAVLAAALAWRI